MKALVLIEIFVNLRNLSNLLILISDQTATVTQNNTTVHILLNAYHRSGSSFTGRMIASQPRPFYFFEPLMQLARFGVFTTDDGLCNDLNGECR